MDTHKAEHSSDAGKFQQWALSVLQDMHPDTDIRKLTSFTVIGKLEIRIGQGVITLTEAKSIFLSMEDLDRS